MIYIVGFCILLILSLIKNNRINDRFFMFFSAGICFFIMAFRSSSVGTDSAMYLNLYDLETSGYSTLLSVKAPLFVWFLRFISCLFPNWNQIYFVFTAFVIITVIWLAIHYSKINCRKAILLYYLLFFLDSLNGTRTYVAAALVYLSMVLFLEKDRFKKIISIILLLIAIFVHNTAVVGIIILLIESLDLSDSKTRKLVTTSMFLLLLLLNPAIDIFVRYFPVYSDTLQNVDDKVGASAVVFQLIFLFSAIIALYCIRKKYDCVSKIGKKSFDNFAVLTIAELLFYFAGGKLWYVQRALIYFEIPIIAFFPILSNIKNRYKSVYNFSVWVVAIFIFLYRIFRNLGNVSPYTFFWQ